MISEKVLNFSKLVLPIGWIIESKDKCFIIGEENNVRKILFDSHKSFNLVKIDIDWIDEYRGIFPSAVRSGGYPVKGDRKGCIKKMEKFLEEYPEYDKEIILEATKSYVKRKERENYAYMQLAHYFINKDGISSLASECENLKEGVEEKENILNI